MVQQQTFVMPFMNMFAHFANILLFCLPTPRGRASRYYLNKINNPKVYENENAFFCDASWSDGNVMNSTTLGLFLLKITKR